jgi:hypothetical protein
MPAGDDARANGARTILSEELSNRQSVAETREKTRCRGEKEECEACQYHARAIPTVESAGNDKQGDREDGQADIRRVVLPPEKVETGGKDAEC